MKRSKLNKNKSTLKRSELARGKTTLKRSELSRGESTLKRSELARGESTLKRSELARGESVLKRSELARGESVLKRSELTRGESTLKRSELARGESVLKRSELARGESVLKRSELARGESAMAKTKLANRSKKRQKHMKEERIPLIETFIKAGIKCEIGPVFIEVGLRNYNCSEKIEGMHERRKSGQGGSRVNQNNLVPACNSCNGLIETIGNEILRQATGSFFVVIEGDSEWEELGSRNDRMKKI